jgi:hypothetical protein
MAVDGPWKLTALRDNTTHTAHTQHSSMVTYLRIVCTAVISHNRQQAVTHHDKKSMIHIFLNRDKTDTNCACSILT